VCISNLLTSPPHSTSLPHQAIKPLLEKAVLKNLLPYVCEGYLFGYEVRLHPP